jgi:hypothetical protein
LTFSLCGDAEGKDDRSEESKGIALDACVANMTWENPEYVARVQSIERRLGLEGVYETEEIGEERWM